MSYNNTDLDNFGAPKENAWKWFLKEYSIILVLWIFMFIAAFFFLSEGTVVLIIFGILATISIAMLIYVPKWYKQLVEENYIQPFSKSKLEDIFK